MSGIIVNGVRMSYAEYFGKTKITKRRVATLSQLQKIILKINKDIKLDIPINATIKQINPTLKQLSRGSFKWCFEGGFSNYGSTLSVRELMRAEKLEITYTSAGGLSTLPHSLIDIQPV